MAAETSNAGSSEQNTNSSHECSSSASESSSEERICERIKPIQAPEEYLGEKL